jgi:transcription elongation GreA/GreB family factor
MTLSEPSPSLRAQLLTLCLRELESRIALEQREIAVVREASAQETKSSAGDKYETARAMFQQQIEGHTRRLAEAESLWERIRQIPSESTSTTVGVGSVVFTNRQNFFVCASLGTLSLPPLEFVSLSLASPLGKLLKGKRAGETLTWNAQPLTLLDVQ